MTLGKRFDVVDLATAISSCRFAARLEDISLTCSRNKQELYIVEALASELWKHSHCPTIGGHGRNDLTIHLAKGKPCIEFKYQFDFDLTMKIPLQLAGYKKFKSWQSLPNKDPHSALLPILKDLNPSRAWNMFVWVVHLREDNRQSVDPQFFGYLEHSAKDIKAHYKKYPMLDDLHVVPAITKTVRAVLAYAKSLKGAPAPSILTIKEVCTASQLFRSRYLFYVIKR
jgi:hypothetical protein